MLASGAFDECLTPIELTSPCWHFCILVCTNLSRAWKVLDWDAMPRLHQQGSISDLVGKAKSVTFTEEGLRESERLLQTLFGSSDN